MSVIEGQKGGGAVPSGVLNHLSQTCIISTKKRANLPEIHVNRNLLDQVIAQNSKWGKPKRVASIILANLCIGELLSEIGENYQRQLCLNIGADKIMEIPLNIIRHPTGEIEVDLDRLKTIRIKIFN